MVAIGDPLLVYEPGGRRLPVVVGVAGVGFGMQGGEVAEPGEYGFERGEGFAVS